MKPVLYKEKLLWLRLQNGWSQEEAASHCGASDKKQYHLWETGKTRLPHASQLATIAAGFSLENVDDILLRPGAIPDTDLQIFYNAHFRRPLPSGRIEPLRDEPPYRLICFALDGVLLRGYHFAWEEIWNLLGEDRELRKKGLRLFHTGRLSYEDWCLWCCDIFRSHDLRHEQLVTLASRFRVIDNLEQGVQALRRAGYRLAIISGSVDVFLQTLIPDHAKWFDQVFINRMQFDSHGSILGITPTPFDFERKPDAVRYLCSLYGFHTLQSICVGSNFVDKHLIEVAGRTIAFNSTSDEVQELFDWRLDSDNFMDLVDSILAL